MIAKIATVFIILVIQLLYLQNFLNCREFNSVFYLNPYQIELQLESDIHNDQSGNIFLVRLFHNKIVAYATAIFDKYIYFFNFSFLASSVSLVGLSGMLIGFVLFARKPGMKMFWLLGGVVLLVPLVELFSVPRMPVVLGIFLLWFVFQFFSLYAWFVFLPKKLWSRRYVFCFSLLLVSLLWYLFFSGAIGYFCSLR